MRVFAAFVPSTEAVDDLDAFLDVRRAAGGFRWTPAHQFHLTLAFMAKASARRVDDYVARLERSFADVPAPQVRLSRAVAFPNAAAARVLAVGVEGELAVDTAALDRSARKARNAAVACGMEVDGSGFRPHITVARLRRPTDVTRWFQLLEGYDGPEWEAGRVTVVASHLGEGPRGRPRHEVVAEVPLG